MAPGGNTLDLGQGGWAMQAALGHQEAASAVPAAEVENLMAILVLQTSLRRALHIGQQQQKIRWENHL